MSYQFLPDPFLVEGSVEYLQQCNDRYSNNTRERGFSDKMWDPRSQANMTQTREPIELPVPQFEIDANYVGEPPVTKEDPCSLQHSKDLDLDTRIDLLIKSKALAGMHPIFSELAESEESSDDSDENIFNKSNHVDNFRKKPQSLSFPKKKILCFESFDDPETPLSRPPSPFLSRATYLFWFNKAIELKQHAKAQEQALLEKATKKLLQGDLSPVKPNLIDNSQPEHQPLLKNLLDDICKELKEIIKQEFIREVLENAAFNTLENWWEKQTQIDEDEKVMLSCTVENSVPTNCRQLSKVTTDKLKNNMFCKKSSEFQGSTPPKKPVHDLGFHNETKLSFNDDKKNVLDGVLLKKNSSGGHIDNALNTVEGENIGHDLSLSSVISIKDNVSVTDCCQKTCDFQTTESILTTDSFDIPHRVGLMESISMCLNGRNISSDSSSQGVSSLSQIAEKSSVNTLVSNNDETMFLPVFSSGDAVDEDLSKTVNSVLDMLLKNVCKQPDQSSTFNNKSNEASTSVRMIIPTVAEVTSDIELQKKTLSKN